MIFVPGSFKVVLSHNCINRSIKITIASHALGALAALGSAFLWAVAAVLFTRLGERMSAISMNIGKGILALIVMGLMLIPGGLVVGDSRSVLLLGVSGILGIALGDTLYFMTLSRLGSRLTLLLGSLIPVTTAVIAAVFLGEHISLTAWCGVALTIAGVTFVMWERSGNSQASRQWLLGIAAGLVFVFANALGIIFSKLGVQDIPSMDATFMRQLWALGGFAFWGLVSAQLIPWIKPLRDPRLLKPLIVAAFVGAFLGTWLSIFALKYTYVTVAAVLNSTSPLFILPLAAWIFKERITLRAVAGAVMAVAGITLYFASINQTSV